MDRRPTEYKTFAKLKQRGLNLKNKCAKQITIPFDEKNAVSRNLTINELVLHYDVAQKNEIIYGGCFNIFNFTSRKGEDLSLRIMDVEDEGKDEEKWTSFHHVNIQTVLERKHHPKLDVVCYLTPKVKATLKHAMSEDYLKRDPRALNICIEWIKGVTNGLSYLHQMGYSYRNLTGESVVINFDNIAQLGDFNFLTDECTCKSFGKFSSNMPPECFKLGIEYVHSNKIDIWMLGVLTINIFTGFYLEKSLPLDCALWSRDVYPFLYKFMKKKTFNKYCKKLFYQNGNELSTKSARNFSAYCLTFNNVLRPSVDEILGHLLLNEKGYLSKKDEIWKQKKHWKSMERKISLLCNYSEMDQSMSEEDTIYKSKTPSNIEKLPSTPEKNFKNTEDYANEKQKVHLLERLHKVQKPQSYAEKQIETEDEKGDTAKKNENIDQRDKNNFVNEEESISDDMTNVMENGINNEKNTENHETYSTRKESKNGYVNIPIWKRKIWNNILNLMMDSSLQNSMLHPENYLHKLTKKI